MDNIQIFDDVFTEEEIYFFQKFLTSKMFTYSYAENTVVSTNKDPARFKDIHSFIHRIIDDGITIYGTEGVVFRLLDMIEERTDLELKNAFRAQVNFTYPQKQQLPTPPHIDGDIPHRVLIYYVFDSDGDTSFYDSELNVIKTCTPKAGRFVLFDGSILHSATPPDSCEKRVVININLEV